MYDLLVIGGGSGGLACANRAAKLGKRVAVCDYVDPSPRGSTWGLGGTCLNVGCIPKKLMNASAGVGRTIANAEAYGWAVEGESVPLRERVRHDWSALVRRVQNYIKSQSFSLRAELMQNGVTYLNAAARFADSNSVVVVDRAAKETTLSAHQIVIATGGRPKRLDIPGGELAISSDDLFSRAEPTGKTLIVGASYIALECAGFLQEMGQPTTVLMRSAPLRGFDRDMAETVKLDLEARGVAFVAGAAPISIAKKEAGLLVKWKIAGEDAQDEFDTVIAAIGRSCDTSKLGLERAGVKASESGKIPVLDNTTNVSHIHAIGDVIDGAALQPPCSNTELTPVAVQSGLLLAERLFADSGRRMDFACVPTAIYTPLEYACIGYSEEDAVLRFGKHDVEVFHSDVRDLHAAICPIRHAGYAKLVCLKSQRLRVVGWHCCAPCASEIVQGFAVAARLGATKHDYDATLGVHPTIAEGMVGMTTLKSERIQPHGC